MNRVDIHHGAATDIGLVRKVNEDAYVAAPPVYLVADGMGGHSGGDVASQIVSEEFALLAEQGYDPARAHDHVLEILQRAQTRLLAYADARRVAQPDWHAGTTAVACVLVEHEERPAWLVANLGDSRAYLLDGHGALAQVTVDHSVVQEMVDAGVLTPDQAAEHPERHVITRALGSRAGIVPDFFLVPLTGGERLLLCSDGISTMIDDEQISTILRSVEDAQQAAHALVAAAVDAGGRDNATAVVIDVVGLASSQPHEFPRQAAGGEENGGAGA
jgi:protein phosphatase